MVRRDVHVIVDLPAVRPARLAERVAVDELMEHVRDFRELLRGARRERLDDGVRLSLHLDVRTIARLADLVRAEADVFPFWSFRLLAAPPECVLEIGGEGRAGELARAVFGELAR
jgi:MerR family transcriptional regulator, copper efflux regulator